jgi:hypothetical protein
VRDILSWSDGLINSTGPCQMAAMRGGFKEGHDLVRTDHSGAMFYRSQIEQLRDNVLVRWIRRKAK